MMGFHPQMVFVYKYVKWIIPAIIVINIIVGKAIVFVVGLPPL